MINDCLEWRDELNLCDWGYFKLVEKMAVGFFGAERVNEARLMQLYVLIQSGYKVRMARAGETLVVLIPSSDNISEYLYLKVNGINYYAIDKSVMGKSFRLFDREFPQEQAFSLRSIGGRPNLSISSEYTKTNKFRIPGADEDTDDIEVSINKHLMDFYNDFPRCNNIDNYAVRSLSEDVKEQLYPQLREMIKDMNQTQSVNMLLSFVQKSFRYKIDEEQFGYERPLFADESLFYPYCDCEDRSVLFSVLVKDLIGLDVVLLNYPNHLATAVLFDYEVEGDFLMLDNKRYIVCDPTYIGASIGQAMPNFKKTTAKVIKI